MRFGRKLFVLVPAFFVVLSPSVASAPLRGAAAAATLLVSGLQGGSGSTIGPDGNLYVAEPIAGRISRIDPDTGQVSVFASGLPARVVDVGGIMDIAFVGRNAYALVTLVGSDVGGDDVVGIYKVDSRGRISVLADIGEFALNNPPETDFFVPTGVQYAMQFYRGGFLVTDGHHNRVLHVGLDGDVHEVMAFGNIVPTGLELLGPVVLMGQAGPVPHEAEDGKIVAFIPGFDTAIEIASGAPLLVDVEFGAGFRLYGLSQGDFPEGNPEGAPAAPNTGALMRVNAGGTFSVLTSGLNQPTSMEFIGRHAYVVTLGGEVWRVALD